MGFASGSVTFRRFAVIGSAPDSVDQDLLDKLASHALRPTEMGVPEEEEYGWSGGRHILDGSFTFENNVYGDALLFGLRIDTNRVPAELRKSYQLMEEEASAAQNPSGFISKLQKKDAKDVTRRRVDEDLRSGKFRRSKLVSILWDLPTQTIYCNVTGQAQEKLAELFERTFGLSLLPVSSGAAALRYLEPKGRRRDYEDSTPTRFVHGNDGEGQRPEYPWVSKSAEPKDFFGNEFLLWLWHEIDSGEATAIFERSLDMDCAYGQSGRAFLRGDSVTKMPEAIDGLRTGKVPRRVGVTLASTGAQYTLTLAAETLSFGALKLPDVEEAENPRVLFEERIGLIRDFCKSIDELFAQFLKLRTSSTWESHVGAIRKWIQRSGRQTATPAIA
ncbi:hypothetical protein BH09PLA1_BH09PLA1_35430 [soil metagenome]